jgi:hypothetical protein
MIRRLWSGSFGSHIGRSQIHYIRRNLGCEKQVVAQFESAEECFFLALTLAASQKGITMPGTRPNQIIKPFQRSGHPVA